MRGLLGVSEAAGILGTEGLFVWYLGALRSAVVCFSEFCWVITGTGVRGRYSWRLRYGDADQDGTFAAGASLLRDRPGMRQ